MTEWFFGHSASPAVTAVAAKTGQHNWNDSNKKLVEMEHHHPTIGLLQLRLLITILCQYNPAICSQSRQDGWKSPKVEIEFETLNIVMVFACLQILLITSSQIPNLPFFPNMYQTHHLKNQVLYCLQIPNKSSISKTKKYLAWVLSTRFIQLECACYSELLLKNE